MPANTRGLSALRRAAFGMQTITKYYQYLLLRPVILEITVILGSGNLTPEWPQGQNLKNLPNCAFCAHDHVHKDGADSNIFREMSL